MAAAVGAGAACFAAPALADFAVLRSTMNGANEVPGPGDPAGTGAAQITLNSATGRLCYTVITRGVTEPLTAGHIHRGAAGVAGPVVVPFRTPRHGITSGCATTSKALIQGIIDDPSGYSTTWPSPRAPFAASCSLWSRCARPSPHR